MEDLKTLREKIDETDRNIVKYFEERMEISLKIAEYKKKNNLQVYDAKREEKVIEKNLQRLQNKNFSESLEKFYKNLMNLSKEEQQKLMK